jgi:hypothetical protein
MSASMSLVILTYFYMDQAGLSAGGNSAPAFRNTSDSFVETCRALLLYRDPQGRSAALLAEDCIQGTWTNADRRKLW